MPGSSTYLTKSPPCIYLSSPLPGKQPSSLLSLQHVLSGLELNKAGELKVVDKQVLQNYKGLMSEMMKKIGTAIS